MNARRKIISINYRCKSAILEEVVPMISNNQDRVDKSLVAHNEGGEVSYLNISDNSEFNVLRENLLGDLNSDIDIDKDVAVLVRFNKDRMLLADKLAEYSIPVDITHTKYILQNDNIYKALVEVATALRTRDPYLMKKHITKCFRGISTHSLDNYLSPNEDFVEDMLRFRLKISKEDLELLKIITTSTNAYTIITHTWKLVKDFYTYMIRMKRLSEKDVLTIISYVINLSLDSEGKATVAWDSFLQAENYKKSYLTEFINDPHVFKIYTMHSVKGLEFSKVYLYGLSGDIVSEEDVVNRPYDEIVKSNATFEEEETYDKSKIELALSAHKVNIEEERRVFYVACTRAINSLVICYYGDNLFALLPEMKNFTLAHEAKEAKRHKAIEEANKKARAEKDALENGESEEDNVSEDVSEQEVSESEETVVLEKEVPKKTVKKKSKKTKSKSKLANERTKDLVDKVAHEIEMVLDTEKVVEKKSKSKSPKIPKTEIPSDGTLNI